MAACHIVERYEALHQVRRTASFLVLLSDELSDRRLSVSDDVRENPADDAETLGSGRDASVFLERLNELFHQDVVAERVDTLEGGGDALRRREVHEHATTLVSAARFDDQRALPRLGQLVCAACRADDLAARSPHACISKQLSCPVLV
nr:hypothetical protein [Nesterenkonia sp. NBAIMH1]